jgi:hypothetical protein
MSPEQLEIAIANTTDPAAKSMLAELAPTFERVCQLNETFPARINANKAARGEAPTKLPKQKREELAGYDQDAIDLERTLTNDYRTLAGPSIIHSMSYALETDLKFWGGAMLKHAHPSDRVLIEEVVEAKRQLQNQFKHFLARFPANHDS